MKLVKDTLLSLALLALVLPCVAVGFLTGGPSEEEYRQVYK